MSSYYVLDFRAGVHHQPRRKRSGGEARLVPLRRLQEQLDSVSATRKHPKPLEAGTSPLPERDRRRPVRGAGELFKVL